MMKTDVLILGGGPSGLAAAYEVASRGYKVILVEESWSLGGQFRQQTQLMESMPEPFEGLRGYEVAQTLIERLQAYPVEVLTNHAFIGLYADGSAAVNNGQEVLKIKSTCIIVATGAAETAVPFPGWTMPGVMTIGAAQILINRERVFPGKNALIIGSSDMALEIAKQMHDVGINVLSVVEKQEQISARDKQIVSNFEATGIPIRWGTEGVEASGNGRLEEVSLKLTKADGGATEVLKVDLICVDGGRHPILEPLSILSCELDLQPNLGGWLPNYNENLQTSMGHVFVAGQAAGVTSQASVILTGVIAGLSTIDLLESTASEERMARKRELWNEIERIESAKSLGIWEARLSHMKSYSAL
jgi:thioredoxin reductase